MTDGPDTPEDDFRRDAVARFVERLALIMVEAGAARMPARVFAMLLATENGKATAGELAGWLRVSPAAISGAVRYLTQLGLAVRARNPGERRDHYEVVDDVWYEMYAHRDKQLEQWSTVLGEGVAAVGAETRAGARLLESQRFFDFLRSEIPGLMRRWREYQRDHR